MRPMERREWDDAEFKAREIGSSDGNIHRISSCIRFIGVGSDWMPYCREFYLDGEKLLLPSNHFVTGAVRREDLPDSFLLANDSARRFRIVQE